MLLGFSTGSLRNMMDRISIKTINTCRDFGFEAIELMVYSLEDVELLKKITKDDLHGFKYVSIHSPGHKIMNTLDKKRHVKVLDDMQECYERLKFDCLVLHPGEWITDWEIFRKYTLPIAFENMDWRHKIATDVSSLKQIFSNKDFKMVLDLNHCYTHDSSMELAGEMYNEFKNIIKHFHMSGIKDSNNTHVPLYRSQKEIIINAIPNLDLPIILETTFKDMDDARKEAEYVKKMLGIKG